MELPWEKISPAMINPASGNSIEDDKGAPVNDSVQNPIVVLVTATAREARPLAGELHMRHVTVPGFQNTWKTRDESTWIMASGVGKLAQAAATGGLLSLMRHRFLQPVRTLNLGIAATPDTSIPVGAVFQVVRVSDRSSGRVFHPDLLFKTGLDPALLVTVDHPVSPGGSIAEMGMPVLYDMEAAGFWQACRQHLPSDSIQSVKVVSDYGVPPGKGREAFESLIKPWENAMGCLLAFIEKFQSLPDLSPPVWNSTIISHYNTLVQWFRLTTTQQKELEKGIRHCLAEGRDPEPVLNRFLGEASPRHARDRNPLLRRLTHELLES